jgi:hypothetical protein
VPGFSDGRCQRHLLLRVRRCLRIGITVADRRKLARIQIRGFWKIRPTRSKTHRGCMLMDTCFGECRVGGCCLCGRHLNRRYLCGCRLRWCCACCFGSIGGLRCGTWRCCIRHRSACMRKHLNSRGAQIPTAPVIRAVHSVVPMGALRRRRAGPRVAFLGRGFASTWVCEQQKHT